MLAVTACGGASSTNGGPGGKARLATATPSGEASRTPGRRASLHYEIRGRPFPLPIVRGTIAGQPVLMLVDTGANLHVVAGWFARRHALAMKKLGDIGTDHVGKSIATYRMDDLEMAIDGWGKLSATTVLATEVPEVLEKLGIAAFISPQRLDEEGDAVVLDLKKGEMRSAWWGEAHYELSVGGAAALVLPDRGRACEEKDGPVKGLAFVVPATVESQNVHLLVDTGAQHSDVFTTSAAGQKLAGQSTANKEAMYTASGKISARKLVGARITTGAFSVTTDVDLIKGAGDASCPRDGVLAMDVLRSCVLLLGRSRIEGRCGAAP